MTQIQHQDLQKREPAPKRTSLLSLLARTEPPALQLVWLNANETVAIPFTADAEEVDIHYCEEADIHGSVRCNGQGCILCRVGRKKETRSLWPVYLPASDCIGVIPVSLERRPHDLLPQLDSVLTSGEPVVLSIARVNYRYRVHTDTPPDDVDRGAAVIRKFKEDYEAGRLYLTSTIRRIDNEQLAQIPEIARVLAFKGDKR